MKLDILAFSAHPDDVEISAGATLLKYVKEGKRIGIVDLTSGELGTRGNAETRMAEALEASKKIGLTVRENLGLKDGFFEINEVNKLAVIQKIRKYQPTIILANSISDRHPDHGRAGQLILEASFLSGLRKIETFEGSIQQDVYRPSIVLHYIQDNYIKPDVVMDVTDFVEEKIELINVIRPNFTIQNLEIQKPRFPV